CSPAHPPLPSLPTRRSSDLSFDQEPAADCGGPLDGACLVYRRIPVETCGCGIIARDDIVIARLEYSRRAITMSSRAMMPQPQVSTGIRRYTRQAPSSGPPQSAAGSWSKERSEERRVGREGRGGWAGEQ